MSLRFQSCLTLFFRVDVVLNLHRICIFLHFCRLIGVGDLHDLADFRSEVINMDLEVLVNIASRGPQSLSLTHKEGCSTV